MRTTFGRVFLGLGVLIATAPAFGKIATQDQEVLRRIHLTNQLEIKLGHLAQKRAGSEYVKQYGRDLVADHEAADKKVLEAAAKEKVIATNPIPAVDKPAEAKEAEVMKALENKEGAAFDQAFTAEMAKAHGDTIAFLTAKEQELKGSPTADLIAQILPTLHKHKDTAGRVGTY